MKARKTILAVALASAAFSAVATEGAWEPVIGYGWSDYDDATPLDEDFDTKFLGLSYYATDELAFELLGSMHSATVAGTSIGADVDTIALRGLYHISTSRPGIVPYWLLGIYGREYDADNGLDDSYGGFQLGAGLKTHFTENFAWRIEFNHSRSTDDRSESQFWTGFSYAFGGGAKPAPAPEPEPVAEPAPAPTPVKAPPAPPADDDKDGVTNNLDQCPDTPANAQVDEVGCAKKLSKQLRVLFETNSSNIKPETMADIDDLATFMTRYPQTSVTIEGHTSSDGADKYNQWLSERRAQSVASALIDKGIAKERVSSVGYGESQPVATNDTAEGRALNRRVTAEIKEFILKK